MRRGGAANEAGRGGVPARSADSVTTTGVRGRRNKVKAVSGWATGKRFCGRGKGAKGRGGWGGCVWEVPERPLGL
jgi:hypothetical protein